MLANVAGFLHDEDGEGSACAATARAAFLLPPASLLVRLSCLLEQIAEVLKVIQQRIVEPIVDEPVPLAEFVGVWEQIVDVPVLRTMEDDVGVVRFTPQEHVQYRVPEQAVGVLVPLITEDGLPIVPQERVLNRVAEQISGVRVPQIIEDSLPVVPQERVQNRTSEQIRGFLEPQVMEYGLPAVPQECVQNRTPEQLVDVPVPQIMEAIAENRFPGQLVDVPVPQIMEAIEENRFPEQLVDVPVPQIMEAIAEDRFPEQIVISPVPQLFEATRGESCRGADGGFLSASVHGGSRGNYAFFTSGERAKSYARADYGLPCPSEHGSVCGTCACSTTGTRTESYSGAGVHVARLEPMASTSSSVKSCSKSSRAALHVWPGASADGCACTANTMDVGLATMTIWRRSGQAATLPATSALPLSTGDARFCRHGGRVCCAREASHGGDR